MFEFLSEIAVPFTSTNHVYTFATIGMKKKFDRTFISRQAANDYMNKIVKKYSLNLEKVWDDHHFKTYCYNDGIKMYINRI